METDCMVLPFHTVYRKESGTGILTVDTQHTRSLIYSKVAECKELLISIQSSVQKTDKAKNRLYSRAESASRK